MEPTYHRESRRRQDRYDTRRLVHGLDEKFAQRTVSEADDDE